MSLLMPCPWTDSTFLCPVSQFVLRFALLNLQITHISAAQKSFNLFVLYRIQAEDVVVCCEV